MRSFSRLLIELLLPGVLLLTLLLAVKFRARLQGGRQYVRLAGE
jgi:hypothetical protein